MPQAFPGRHRCVARHQGGDISRPAAIVRLAEIGLKQTQNVVQNVNKMIQKPVLK
jgi:hypothetical protein